MTNLSANSINVTYNGKIIIKELNLYFEKLEIISIIGPNGSGKSTILKTLGRLLKATKGNVLLDGKDIHRLPAKEVARKMSILPQGPQAPGDITVKDLVSYGRSPYQGFLSEKTDSDRKIIDWAMEETNVKELANREVNTLSGGERQRAWIAMAIAQQPQILLLDEPTTFLDIRHQFEVMELLQRLHERLNIMIIMVLHDLNHALRYSNRVIAIKNGKIFRDGSPSDVITEETLMEVFGIRTRIIKMDMPLCYNGITCIPYGIYNDRGDKPKN